MRRRSWLAVALMLVVFAVPARARQGRSAGGAHGGFSTGRQAVPRGGDGGVDRSGGSRAAGATRPAVLRTESPQPTPPTQPPPRLSVSPGAPASAPRIERFAYPAPTRPLGNTGVSRQRTQTVPAPPGARTASPSFRPGAPARYAAPRGSVQRNPAVSSYAVPRGMTRSSSPRYVAPGWRSGSGSHIVVVPRYVHPGVLRVAPYRPYCYRPSIGIGVYYGVGGFYPFGEVAPEYYDPSPDAALGGVRITEAPREAQVFVDGAYVGIVDDFDGPGQHLNLEPGPHRIEIHTPATGAIAFDVTVQQGRTITLRASVY